MYFSVLFVFERNSYDTLQPVLQEKGSRMSGGYQGFVGALLSKGSKEVS
jgi:hypothetical protein